MHVCPSAIAYSFFILFFYSKSLAESIHGGSGHDEMMLHDAHYQLFDQKKLDQLFASSGAIKFPVTPVTEAWREKVSSLVEI